MPQRAMRLPRAGLTTLALALALLLSACGGGKTNGALQRSSAPKATPTVAIPQLSWRKITTPIDLTHGGVSMGVSPVNGRDAWICGDGASAGQFLIWRTQDAGATWSQVSSLSPVAPPPTAVSTACSVIPDQNVATSVAIWLPTANPSATPGPTSSALAYYSSDGGITWTQMPHNWWIDQVATSGATTYALVNDLGHQSDVNVFASSDRFTTWRAVNPTAQEWAQNPPILWVAPDSSDALLSTNYQNQLFHSTDGGQTWTQTIAQSDQAAGAQLAVWRGQNGGWLICGEPARQALCSADLGKTWTARPDTGEASCAPVGLTSDGSLYDVCPAVGAYGSAEPYTLMRLSLGASAWTAVGRAPDKYITVTQSGQIWCSAGDGSATYVLDHLP